MKVEHLSKAFGHKVVLRDLSLTMPPGARIGLMGPSGCGKTTLLRILMGLETADSGILTGFQNVRIGAVFQEDRLIEHWSAEDNLRLVMPRGSAADHRIRTALDALGLSAQRTQRASSLSGGQKRRVALARALLVDPALLLLDEPFKGLDDELRDRACQWVTQTLPKAARMVLVTHDLRETALLHVKNVVEMVDP